MSAEDRRAETAAERIAEHMVGVLLFYVIIRRILEDPKHLKELRQMTEQNREIFRTLKGERDQ